MSTRQFAATRTVALALVVFSLSAAGHSAESAALPSLLGVAVTLALSIGLTSAALARPRSMTWLVAFLAGAQGVIHVVLVVSATNHHPGSSALVPLLPSGAMIAAHLVASVAAAAVLAFGERTLVAWARLLSTAIGPRVSVGLAITPAPVGVVVSDPFTVTFRDAAWGVARRGPPVLVSA